MFLIIKISLNDQFKGLLFIITLKCLFFNEAPTDNLLIFPIYTTLVDKELNKQKAALKARLLVDTFLVGSKGFENEEVNDCFRRL